MWAVCGCKIPPVQPPNQTKQKKQDGGKKRASGKSKNRPRGIERKPLITKAEFTQPCLADLEKHHFNPPKQRFVPDGRWECETYENGKRVKFTRFLMSFD